MQNVEKFREYVSLIAEKFDKEISKAMASMIWKTLQPFSDQDCEKAFESILIKSRYFKDLLPDLMEQLGGSEEDKATLAWLEVDKAVRHVGNYASVKFNDPIIHSTIEAIGGWESLGNAREDEWKWVRKDFISMYPRMARKRNHLDKLIGRTERENLADNYPEHIPETVKVGPNNKKRLLQ